MHHALRRTAVIVASSAVVLAGAPLVDFAYADTALTQSSVTPTNAQSVKDSHPAISASYTDNSAAANLDPSSTITVSKGATSIGCTGVVSGNTITCNYSGLLTSGSYSIVIHAVEAANTAKTADNTTTFTVNVPTRVTTNTAPAANSTVASFSSVVVNFDQAIDDDSTVSKISVQQIADRQPDGTYAPASHTPLTGTVQFPNDGKTLSQSPNNTATEIEFDPSSAPVNKGVYQVTLDVFGTNGDQTSTAAATENAKAETRDSYTFIMDNTPPAGATNLAVSPTPATKSNDTAIAFSGNAKPGNTITVNVTDGSKHVTNSGTSNGGPLTVPTCASATSCPWSKTLDVSSLADATLTWTATEANGVGTTPENGPSFLKDTTAPAGAHVAGTFPTSPTVLHVTGGSDSTVDSYTLDISDSSNPANTIPRITLTKANGDINPDGTFAKDVDVSSLNDGTLHVSLVAIDQYGNAAAAVSPATAPDKESGIQLIFGSSYFKLVNTDTPSFTEVLARGNHAVQAPAQIAIEFSNPVTLTRHDTGTVNNTPSTNSGGHDVTATAPQFVEVLPNGSTGNTVQGTPSIDPNDPRKLIVTPPPGLADGSYKLFVNVFEGLGKCDWNGDPVFPSTTPVPAPTCPSYNDYINVPNSSPVAPFVFTVDTKAPAPPVITTIPEGTIDGSNVGDVLIKGTAEAGSTVTLTAKSSGGGSVLALNQGQPVTVDSNGNWQDDENNAALGVLPDGTITISGTATDVAGNVGQTGTDTVTLAARPGTVRSLAVSVTDSSFTLHWLAPAYDGFPALQNGNATSHLTGYTYTYQDTTNGAVDTSLHSVDVNDPNTVSATQAGLLPGHTYNVTLCALNGVDGPCNKIATTATPAYATSVTANVSKALVVYGNPITLSGRLTRNDIGAGIANEPLTVTPRFDDGSLGAVMHVTTDSFGSWSLPIAKPAKDALYLVAFDADNSDPTYQASNSAVRSLVEVSLRIDKLTAKFSSHTVPITVTGHISPSQAGRVVNIYARAAGANHYQRIASVKISSTSTWSYSHAFGAGKFYLFANFATQNGNVGGNSQSVSFART